MKMGINASGESNRRVTRIIIIAVNIKLKELGLPQTIDRGNDADYLVRKVGGKTLYDGRIVRCQMGILEADANKGEKRLLLLEKAEREPNGELADDEILIEGRVRIVDYSIIYVPLTKEEKARLENEEFTGMKKD